MRKPMITRRIYATEVTVMAVNLQTAEVFNSTISVARVYKDKDKLFKVVQKSFDNEEQKAVQIVDTKVIDKLIGMTEEDFLRNGVELDSTTRKPLA